MSADLRARIAELEAEIELLAIGHRSLKQASIEALERAEQAEADLARSKDVAIREAEQVRSERNRYAERAEQAEALADEHAANARDLGERLRQAEAERDRLKDLNTKLKATIDAFPDANSAANLAHARRERDQLRAAVERVRETAEAARRTGCGAGWNLDPAAIRAALDQAPAAEQDGGGE